MSNRSFKHMDLAEILALIQGKPVESTFPTQLLSLINEALQPYLNQVDDKPEGGLSLDGCISEALLAAEMLSTPDKHKDNPQTIENQKNGRAFKVAVKEDHLDTDDLNALFIFQLDHLIGQHKVGDFDAALHTFADLMEISWFRESILVPEFSESEKKFAAKRSADVRHRPMNKTKNDIQKEWDATGHEYESQADFARIISGVRKLKERTVYDWITAHKKYKTQQTRN